MSRVERLVERFIYEVSYGRSIDWYLVKLSSIVYEIEDLCRYGECDPEVLFKDFLSDKRVRKALEPLACYRDDVLAFITSNPRFRNLRRYTRVIEGFLAGLPCTAKELEVVPRPATWVIEEEAVGARRRREKATIEVPMSSAQRIERVVSIATIAVFVIGILLVIYMLFGS